MPTSNLRSVIVDVLGDNPGMTGDGAVDLSGYAKKEYVHAYVDNAIEELPEPPESPDLSGYATKAELQEAISEIDIPPAPDMSNYATKSEVDEADAEIAVAIAEVSSAVANIVIPAAPDLSPYALAADVPEIVEAELANMEIDVPQGVLDRITALETALANAGSGGGGGGGMEPDFVLDAEVDTGTKWVDGKTIFKRTFLVASAPYGAPSAASSLMKIATIGAVDTCVRIEAYGMQLGQLVGIQKWFTNADVNQHTYVYIVKATGSVEIVNTPATLTGKQFSRGNTLTSARIAMLFSIVLYPKIYRRRHADIEWPVFCGLVRLCYCDRCAARAIRFKIVCNACRRHGILYGDNTPTIACAPRVIAAKGFAGEGSRRGITVRRVGVCCCSKCTKHR